VGKRISMATRTELIAAIKERYWASQRAAKSRMLSEFVAVSGYHRKHAIRLLRERPSAPLLRRAAHRVYGSEVRDALIVLWETSDRVCSKRLQPLIPVLLPALEQHGKLVLDDRQRERLLSISAATIDRLLSEVRIAAAGGRRRRAGLSSAIRRSGPGAHLQRLERPAPWLC
jgi:hypothetical protein